MLISRLCALPDGVTVAQLILDQFVLVRIQIGQPFFCLYHISQSIIAICNSSQFLSVKLKFLDENHHL